MNAYAVWLAFACGILVGAATCAIVLVIVPAMRELRHAERQYRLPLPPCRVVRR